MENMKRKELINNYKQQEVEMGIIQIYNTVNGYSFVDICLNLYKPFESIKFKLNLGKIRICLICGKNIGINTDIINDHMITHGSPVER